MFALRATAILILSALLGGCTETAPTGYTVAPSDRAIQDPAEFSETTGAIEGLVTDDSLSPIAGAEVALAELGRMASTDAGGRFAFSHLEPGRYALAAARPGYQSAVRAVDIVAGERTEAKVQLVPLPSDEPHPVTRIASGLICFGANLGQSVVPENAIINQTYTGSIAGLPCELAKSVIGSSPHLMWNLQLNGSSSFLVETAWKPGQGLANGLITKLQYFRLAGKAGTPHAWVPHEARGASPINVSVKTDIFGLTTEGQPNCAVECIQSRHQPYAVYPVGPVLAVNVLIQQRFDEYLTTFYGPTPERFTALPDA